jgi:hypothetical protein
VDPIDRSKRTFVKLGGLALAATAVPVVATPVEAASPNARFGLEFGDPADVADNPASTAGWVVDRRAPESWTTDGGRLRIDVDESAETSGFYRFQGKKYLDADGAYWCSGTDSRLSYRFYIDPAWETDGSGQRTGVRPTLGDANGDVSAHPRVPGQRGERRDGRGGLPRLRLRVRRRRELRRRPRGVGLPKKLGIDPDEGGWVDVEVQLQKTGDGAAVKWRVDGKLVHDERNYDVFAPSTQFLEFIVNSRNFGSDRSYDDDVELTEPGGAKNG